MGVITPIEPARRINTDFTVCDIENRSNGKVLSIDVYDGHKHHEFLSWEQFLDFVTSEAVHDKAYRTVYAHNGCGWDWLSLIEYIACSKYGGSFNAIQNGGTIIAVKIVWRDRVISLVDSLKLLQCSLDKAGYKYLGEGKLELEHLPEWYWENDRATYTKYHRRDCELLYRVMLRFIDTIRSIAPISRLGITLPSTAMRLFRTGFLSKEIVTPEDSGVKSLLREGYQGGRVEVFKAGYYPNIRVYDFNSLYPSVMVDTPVPTANNVCHTLKFRPDKCGVYRIRYVQRNRKLLPLLMWKGKSAYEGEGVFYANEIRRLLEQANGRIEILQGMVFGSSDIVFAPYVQTLYSLRMTDKDGPIGDVCKLLMNSLYGKFGIKAERCRTAKLTYEQMEELADNGNRLEILSEEYGIYRIHETCIVPYEHCGIAGTITSEARARLWESLTPNVVYCDTDSLHTTGTHETSKELGKLKLEFEGEGVYCGKKLYALRSPDKKEKVRVKGVKVGGKMGCRLDFSDIRGILEGHEKRVMFRSAVTANSVFKGGKSCVFVERKRTIRRTDNLGCTKRSRKSHR